MPGRDWEAVRRIYGEGIATRTATFTTEVPTKEALDAQWLAGHRWVAEIDGVVVGWAGLSLVPGPLPRTPHRRPNRVSK
ncbi:MAG: GNAT family N-acetyltransferase, partial [Pseudonocardiaceae bacterium]